MPRLVKIGCTAQAEIGARLNQLYSTSVPFPFEVEFAARVANPEEVEQALHQAFAPNRVNPRREFFEIDPSQAIAILNLLHVEDATREVEEVAIAVDPQDSAAAQLYRSRRPPLNFVEMGIPIGSALFFTRTDATVKVISPRRVSLDGADISLTAATRTLMGVEHDVAPAPYWTFNGRTLQSIYNETYQRPS